MITQLIIEQVQQTLNWGFAGSISVLMLVVVLAVFALYDRVLGLSTHDRRVGARPRERRGQHGLMHRVGDAVLDCSARQRPLDRAAAAPARRPRCRAPLCPLRTVALLVLLFLSVPALLMIPLSFGKSGLNWPPSGFTLQHYQNLVASPLWMSAALRSLGIGLGAAMLRHADRHAGRLPARARADARQVADARLRALADHRAAHDHRGRHVLFLRAASASSARRSASPSAIP